MVKSSGGGRRYKTVVDAIGKMEDKVDEVSWEGEDGIWVYLKFGFINPQLEAHCYHEFSAGELVAAMRDYPPVECNCEECNKRIGE